MNTQQAYDIWSEIYDTNVNRTRDLEAHALRDVLSDITFAKCLEIGCGTGKNTEWLISKCDSVLAVDFSEAMLAKARVKVISDKVVFKQADILENWDFTSNKFDLITFSLMLEHIENIGEIFKKSAELLNANGLLYVGELHPFKQHTGSKARFDSEKGQQIVTCYNHNVSEFVRAAKSNGFDLMDIEEYFDDDDRTSIPRIFTLLLRKK